MRDLPTGTLTLLFTDIAGSTRLLQRLGERYDDALAVHRDLLRAVWTAHEGHEVGTQGDAFFVVFARATQAVAAAVAGQRALAAHRWPEGGAVSVRIGLHTGDPGAPRRTTSASTCTAPPASALPAMAARSSSRGPPPTSCAGRCRPG